MKRQLINPMSPRPQAIAGRIAAAALLGMAANAAFATQWGTVVSSTPVAGQVPVPQQQCYDRAQVVQQPTTGAGSVIGAIAGGVIGNAFGHGAGRALATGAGVVAGSVIGNNVEAGANPPVETTVRQCQTVTHLENRIVGYDVVYDYGGQRYTTRMASDPGQRIPLDVNVAPVAAAPAYAAPPVYAAPAVYAQAPVYVAPAPVYVAPPPVVVGPAVWIGGGWGHRWR